MKLLNHHVLLLTFLLAFTGIYFHVGTHLIYQTNRNRLASDQQYNIKHARMSREHQVLAIQGKDPWWHVFPHYSEAVVSPLWPWVAGMFAPAQPESDEVFYHRGRWFHIGWTALFCCGFALVLRYGYQFSLLATCNLTSLAGFGVFLPRAFYFQPEPFFYALFFVGMLFSIEVLRENRTRYYAFAALALGLAYLSKASANIAIAGLLGVTCLRAVLDLIPRFREAGWSSKRHWLKGLPVFLLILAVVLAPLFAHLNDAFGSPLYSRPKVWMWFESFEEAVRFTSANPDMDAIRKLPADERPGPVNYLRQHSPAHVWDRMIQGTAEQFTRAWFPKTQKQKKRSEKKPWRVLLPDRGNYLLAFFGMLLATLVTYHFLRRRHSDLPALKTLCPEWGWIVFFVCGVTAVSAVALGFYAPIGAGSRFGLGLTLSLAFVIAWPADALQRTLRGKNRLVYGIYQLSQLVLFLYIAARLVALVAHPSFDIKPY